MSEEIVLDREAAVQAAVDQVKTEAAVAALDTPAAPAAAAVAAPVVVDEPVEVAPVPSDAVVPEPIVVAPRPLDYDAFVDLQNRVAALEQHVAELVSHLAQSFGDVYAQKKASMGV